MDDKSTGITYRPEEHITTPAYNEGHIARERGVRKYKNPHKFGSIERANWNNGWEDANDDPSTKIKFRDGGRGLPE